MSLLSSLVDDLVKENKLRQSMTMDSANTLDGGLVSADFIDKLRKNQLPLNISQIYGEAASKAIEGLPTGRYNLKSGEFANFLDIPKVEPQASWKIYDRLSASTDLSDIDNEVSRAIGENSWNPSIEYFEKLRQHGATVDDLRALTNYQNFGANWKEGNAIEKINKLTQIAQQHPDPTYSFSTKEGPLYRGGLSQGLPEVGQEFTFKGNRFKSFSPDLVTAWDFIIGKPPSWKDAESKTPVDHESMKTPSGRNTLFQIVQEPTDKYNYFITPGPQESEVLGRPDAKYQILDKKTFKDFDTKVTTNPLDIDVVRLKQIYAADPFGAAIEGGRSLIKQNPTGTLLGASVSMMNPEVAKAVEQNRYDKAAGAFAKDIVSGALTEAGIKTVVPIAGKFAPGLIKAVTPVAGIAGPVVTGATLFDQGRTGSLTDVLTKKAANVVPGLRANPKTDIGRRAGNELQYIFNRLRQGRMPYWK